MTKASGKKTLGEGDLTFVFIDHRGTKWEVTGKVEAEIKYTVEYPDYEYGPNSPICVRFVPKWQEFRFDGLFVEQDQKQFTVRRIDD